MISDLNGSPLRDPSEIHYDYWSLYVCLRQVIYCITCTYCNKLYIGETGRLISEDRISSYCLCKISIKQAEKKNRNPPIPSYLKNFHSPLKKRWQKMSYILSLKKKKRNKAQPSVSLKWSVIHYLTEALQNRIYLFYIIKKQNVVNNDPEPVR